MNPDLLEKYQWLANLGPEWFQQLGSPTLREQPRGAPYNPWQRALLEEQRQLRSRARHRFPDPDKWLWTDRSLAQASDWLSASFKAQLVPPGAHIIDACCGAGADLVALAQRCRAIGIDSDGALLALAAANLRAHAVSAELEQRSWPADQEILDSNTWLHVDPDRRMSGRRTSSAEEFSPSLSSVVAVAQHAAGAIVKLAPRTVFTTTAIDFASGACQRIWIGNQQECRQLLLLFGKAQAGLAQLLSLSSGNSPQAYREHWFTASREVSPSPHWQSGDLPRMAALMNWDDKNTAGQRQIRLDFFEGVQSTCCDQAKIVALASDVGDYVYDLHATLHAAELESDFATAHQLTAITSPEGYYTSQHRIDSPWVQCFRMLDVVACDDRRVRQALRALSSGPIEVKSRLLKLDANHLQRKYSTAQGHPFTLLITRIGTRTRCLIARREPGYRP